MKKFFTILVFFILSTVTFSQQITGLSGWNIYLDPGHSQKENMGVYGYSEAERVLRVGLHLRKLLLENTDIDTVYICRDDDNDVVGLSARTDEANALGAKWYHSIHSDASSNSSTNTGLLLWGMSKAGVEKTPNGGKAMSAIMTDLLFKGYRISGKSWGDCAFYGTCSDDAVSYLSVNRRSIMASELSEAGFHTSLVQNQLNMNAEWRYMEALTLYWSILKYHNKPVTKVNTVMGIIRDADTQLPINGATIKVGDYTYTTDSYQSLFNKYSSDSTLLRNGFYFIDSLPSGNIQVSVNIPGYDPYTATVALNDTFFTFHDISLTRDYAPKVVAMTTNPGDSLYPGTETIGLSFSRPMDKVTFGDNLVITPSVPVTFVWTDSDKRVSISTSNFAFGTEYQITLKGTAKDKYGHLFDGNNDNVPGADFNFSVKTKVQDVTAPYVEYAYPSAATDDKKPVINIVFSESINASSFVGKYFIYKQGTTTAIPINTPKHTLVNRRSIFTITLNDTLVNNNGYTIFVAKGVKDPIGNTSAVDFSGNFQKVDASLTLDRTLEDFEVSIANWKQPADNISSKGIVPEGSIATQVITLAAGGTKSMELKYAFNQNASEWLLFSQNVNTASIEKTGRALQTYLFGDSRKNKLRFVFEDASGLEVSKWYTIDWLGWKLVEFPLENPEMGTWAGNGNGNLDAPFKFRGIQLEYSGNPNSAYGTIYFDDIKIVKKTLVSVEDEINVIPDGFTLNQNYPNPFNPSTTISFSLASASYVKLEVFNSLGEKVQTLLDGMKENGTHQVVFNTNNNYSSGTYFYKLTAIDNNNKVHTITKKLSLLK